ncbi:MAG TPA: L-seryl-tRNA(Sec) selenium transferase [Dehalococcoidia bacterium]|jgi:L-seryl-tRNA(Ser) seleniumtransferase|nr:L-seryl-tRNA(Sec) selenium transferase [Dehalococcoidia bacterium]|tara:strand:- start:1206 stop:2567 length:1362 start_codon:yes stop_codon:yes gene_type:complete
MEYRNIPSVEAVINTDSLKELSGEYPREWLVDITRLQISNNRIGIKEGHPVKNAEIISMEVVDYVKNIMSVKPRDVINASGVIIHTNLGRAPLSEDSITSAMKCSEGYSDLEFDLESGKRGARLASVKSLLTQLTQAEDAVVVNNNAAALLLALSALCTGKEVIVPRSEAIEIGGGFRIPDVLSQSGATLVDIGTTNRTYISDYERAISDNTGAFLKAHSSNFVITGFTHEVSTKELSIIGKKHGIPVMHDVGSGAFLDTSVYGLTHEPTPQESIADGADLVFFSGDKLLGGPQSGIIIGKKAYISVLERHPMMRAIRMDKMNLAALSTTLGHYLKNEALTKIPVWKMISTTNSELMQRLQAIIQQCQTGVSIQESESAIGGGSLPGETIPTKVLSIDCSLLGVSAEKMQSDFRKLRIPIVVRIENEKVIIDPRTISPADDEYVKLALQSVLK